MTARSAAAIASLAFLVRERMHELLRGADRDTDPGEAGRVGVPPRADRRLHLRRHRRRRREPRDGAAASQPAAQQDESARDRSGSPAARRAGRRAGGEDCRRHVDASRRRARCPGTPAAPATGAPEETRKPEDRKQEPPIRSKKDLEKFDRIFADAAFWKKLGEEYESPLIVTGTIMFTPQQTAGFVKSESRSLRSAGAAPGDPVARPTWSARASSSSRSSSSSTDAPARRSTRKRYRREVLYPSQQSTPALATYFELMDQLIPDFLGALSTQKIRGTRILLR